jgi:hypothetical protein
VKIADFGSLGRMIAISTGVDIEQPSNDDK